MEPGLPYDPRYLAGIVLFNRRDFFEAHEVWESLWLSADVGENRRFIQGLIQAAVAMHHLETNNPRGAQKLFGTAQNYMAAYPDIWLGLNHPRFWKQMENYFAARLSLNAWSQPEGSEDSVPRLELDPPPVIWPNPDEFLEHED
jgi:hypothetical protein